MSTYVDGTDSVQLGNVYALARLAGCLAPDDEMSSGAAWLDEIAFRVVQCGSAGHEVAAVMVEHLREHELWKIYADLGGWEVEMIGSNTDMTANARCALRHIAYKLASAIQGSTTREESAA